LSSPRVIHLALITNFFLFPVFCFSLLRAQDLQSAQQASRPDSLVGLEHTTHPLALLANDAGRVEAGKNLQRIVLVLAPRGDTNWLGADSAAVALSSSDFAVSVSPNPVLVSGGSAGSATVIVAPTGGFTGIVALSCPTGGTAPPAGYACTFSPSSSVDVTVGSVSATLNLAPAAAAAAAVKQTALLQKLKSTHSDATILPGLGLKFPGSGVVTGLAVAFGISLLILLLGIKRLRPSVGYVAMAATCLTIIVIGCGRGGSGGGGGTPPVVSTTTLTSSNLKAQFQAPVNFNVNVSSADSPTGQVQLYDNGQVFGNAVPLNAGLALFSSDALPVGLHSISAKCQGDTNTLPSTSASISQIITGTVNLQITASSQSGTSHTANFNVTVN
jgi:hypothetical protein